MFRRWPALMPPAVQVRALQLPGREEKFGERPLMDIGLIAEWAFAELGTLPALNLALFGHSMGALVAFELAHHLKSRGIPVSALIVSACRAPRTLRPSPDLCLPTDREITARLREAGGTPEEVLRNPQLLQALYGTLRADYHAVDSYRCTHGDLLSIPIYAYGGAEDPLVPPDELNAWQDETTASFSLTTLPGDHFYLKNMAPQLCSLVVSHVLQTDSADR